MKLMMWRFAAAVPLVGLRTIQSRGRDMTMLMSWVRGASSTRRRLEVDSLRRRRTRRWGVEALEGRQLLSGPGAGTVPPPLAITAQISPKSDPDGNGVV